MEQTIKCLTIKVGIRSQIIFDEVFSEAGHNRAVNSVQNLKQKFNDIILKLGNSDFAK